MFDGLVTLIRTHKCADSGHFDGVVDLLKPFRKKVTKLSNLHSARRFLAHNSKTTCLTASKPSFVPINVLIPVILMGLLTSIDQSEAELQKYEVRVRRIFDTYLWGVL